MWLHDHTHMVMTCSACCCLFFLRFRLLLFGSSVGHDQPWAAMGKHRRPWPTMVKHGSTNATHNDPIAVFWTHALAAHNKRTTLTSWVKLRATTKSLGRHASMRLLSSMSWLNAQCLNRSSEVQGSKSFVFSYS